jgi:threonine synthase
MHYISTRGDAPTLPFADALLAGLARDGGLYLPQSYPKLSESVLMGLQGKSYTEIAQTVLTPYVGDTFKTATFKAMIEAAYSSFRHEAVTPLVQISANEWILELFHGPTLAFKDLAMQLLGRMMDNVLQSRHQRATIIGATSGDTGGAAIEAFRGLKNVDMFILFPDGRVSDVQRRMMTTVNEPNVHAIAVDGSFDDCQAMVKALFNHHSFRDEVRLSGVNSINWARIAAQIVYYFNASAALGMRPTRYIVPTGNFGDIFAGFVAKQMGLPIVDLTIATNENDILHRTIQSGVYEVTGVHETSSPSMDIQVSSNFERLLFETNGRDATGIRAMMGSLTQSSRFEIANEQLKTIRQDFTSSRASESEVQSVMQNVLAKSGYLLDPHTACGVVASRKSPRFDVPNVILSTAHPAKFPDIVKKYAGVDAPLPPSMGDLMTRKETFALIKADPMAFEHYILKNIPSH